MPVIPQPRLGIPVLDKVQTHDCDQYGCVGYQVSKFIELRSSVKMLLQRTESGEGPGHARGTTEMYRGG